MAAILLSKLDDQGVIDSGVKYLNENANQSKLTAGHYFYGQYFLSLAVRQAGDEHFRKWYPANRDQLLDKQRSDGSWPKTMVDAEYSTANACITLLSPLRTADR